MQETGLFKGYSIQTLLDKLDVIECFETPGKARYIGEILNQQKDIYQNLEAPPPASL